MTTSRYQCLRESAQLRRWWRVCERKTNCLRITRAGHIFNTCLVAALEPIHICDALMHCVLSHRSSQASQVHALKKTPHRPHVSALRSRVQLRAAPLFLEALEESRDCHTLPRACASAVPPPSCTLTPCPLTRGAAKHTAPSPRAANTGRAGPLEAAPRSAAASLLARRYDVQCEAVRWGQGEGGAHRRRALPSSCMQDAAAHAECSANSSRVQSHAVKPRGASRGAVHARSPARPCREGR